MARSVTPPPENASGDWSRRLACAACILIPILLLALLTQHHAENAPMSLRWDDMQLSASPPMPMKEFLKEIRAAGKFPEVLNLQEPGILERIRETIVRHDWVESVQRVALIAPAQLRIDLHFRKPVARIENGTQIHWVDRLGKLLLPVTNNRDMYLIPIIGWNDRQVDSQQWLKQAAFTAQKLENDLNQWNLASIQIVDQSRLDVAELRLKTKGGTAIIWQTLKGSNLEEPTVEEKISRLRIYYERYGTLEVPVGYVLDVRVKEGLQRKQQSP